MVSEVKTISGRGIPLPGSDIDTDRIIPARFLRCVTFDGLGQQVFADDRAQTEGQHPFDLPQYQGARILIVNANFGCGSSREHAPQAIAKWGIQAIVGESFAEIFLGNCVAIGIPCLVADPVTVRTLQQQVGDNPQQVLEVDLTTQQVHCGDFTATATLPEGLRHLFISGTWDACGQLLSQQAQIEQQAKQIPYLTWT
uniref:3-isopropylmalate dehydratase small subunit n=1 Tax=Cyanothece sp. (strain PCC 7425 / ATCC 29141) TaxID=395961 RepID=B8HNH3_CYAP4